MKTVLKVIIKTADMETTVSILDGVYSVYCKCDWKEDGDNEITVLGSSKAWSGTLDTGLLEAAAKKLGDCPLEEVLKQAKSAFSGNLEKYSVSVENDKLFWKKHASKVKIKLAEVQLKELPDFATVQRSFMESLIKDNQSLQRTNLDLQRRQEKLVKSVRDYQATLEIFTKEKADLEDNLYSKFLPLLNAKKEVIARLKDSGAVENEEEMEKDKSYDVDTDVEEDANGIDDANTSKKIKTDTL